MADWLTGAGAALCLAAMLNCAMADAAGGVTWEDAMRLARPHDVRTRTWLVRAGEPTAIIAVPDDPDYRPIAEGLARRIAQIAGIAPPIVPASKLVSGPAMVWAPTVREGGPDLILLGDLTSNRAIARLYTDWYAWEDAVIPGAGGHTVRTVVSPTGAGWNAVILGGPGPDEVAAAARAWTPGIDGGEGGAFAPFRFEVEFGEHPFLGTVTDRLATARAWPEAWRSFLPRPDTEQYRAAHGQTGALQWAFDVLTRHVLYGGLYYGTSGEPAFARMAGDGMDALYENLAWVEANRTANWDAHYMIEMWLRGWQQVANSPDITRRQRERGYAVMAFLAGQMWIYRGTGAATPYRILSRHQYSGVFASDALCRYVRRQCDLQGALAAEIAANRAAFGPVIHEMMQTYTTGFDHKWGLDGNWHLLQYAAEEPVPEYLTSGRARRNADFATMCINNAGEFVNFGAENIGAMEGYDAWQILGRAATLTGDGRYQWWLDNRMKRPPYKVFIMSMSWLGHWYQTALDPVEPTDMIGINRILVPAPLYEDLRLGRGRLYAGIPVVNDVALADGFNKITFRDGLGEDDQYLMLDGLGGVTYSGNDANALAEYSRFGTPLIVQYTLKHEPFYQNTCSVSRGNSGDPVGTFAELLQMADLQHVLYTQSLLTPLQGADHTRHVFMEKGGQVVILDDLRVHEADEYFLACTFRGFGRPELDRAAGTWTLRNADADLHLQRVALPGISPTPRLVPDVRTVAITYGGEEFNVQVLRETVAGTMAAGEGYRFANVFTGARRGEACSLRAVGLSEDAIAVVEPQTVIYGAPRSGTAELPGLAIDSAAFRLAANSVELVALTRLKAGGEVLLEAAEPVTVEIDFASGYCRLMSPQSRCTGTIAWEPEWARECSPAELARGVGLPDGTRITLDPESLQAAVRTALEAARHTAPADTEVAAEPSAWPGDARQLLAPSATIEASARTDLTGNGSDELIMARADGHLLALTVDGEVIFDAALSESALLSVWAGELQGRPTVLSGARDGMVYACGATGEVLWSYHNTHWGYGARPSVYSLTVGDFTGEGGRQLALGCHGGVALLDLQDGPSFVHFTEVYAHDIVPISPIRLPGQERDWVLANSRGGGLKLVDPVAGVVVNGWAQMWGGRAWYQHEHRIGDALWFVHAGFNGLGAARLDEEKWRAGERGSVWAGDSWYTRTDGETRVVLVHDFDGDGAPEILSANQTGFLVCYRLTGERLWTRLIGTAISDLLRAGILPDAGEELVAAGQEPGITVLGEDRRELARWSPENGASVIRVWSTEEGLILATEDGQVWRLAVEQ